MGNVFLEAVVIFSNFAIFHIVAKEVGSNISLKALNFKSAVSGQVDKQFS